jgi:hypothetical protein
MGSGRREGSRKGQALVVTIVMLPVVAAGLALSLTIGTVYLASTRLQTAVDSAALAGAQTGLEGSPSSVGNQSAYIAHNVPGASGSVALDSQKQRTVVATGQVSVPGGFAQLFGRKLFNVSARAEASWGPGPAFNYAVLQGATSGPPLTFHGAGSVVGAVHSNDALLFDGSTTVTLVCEGVSGIIMSGQATCEGGHNPSAPVVTMPVWTVAQLTPPDATVIGSPGEPDNVVYDSATTWSGNHIVYGSVTFNSSATITGDNLVYGNVIFDGAVNMAGSLTTVGGSITFNGAVSQENPNQGVAFAAMAAPGSPAPANIIVDGSPNLVGILYAPDGSITFNGAANVTGAVLAQLITFNGSANIVYDGNQATAVPVQTVYLVQ